MKPIYLDYNATTPVAPSVARVACEVLEEHYANPTSPHAMGRQLHERIKRARAMVAELLGCKPREIIFTSGGTEANNQAVKGVAFARAGRGKHLITSVVDHAAVRLPMKFLEGLGYEVTLLPVDQGGRISPQDLADNLRPDTTLVSILHAQNEVGTLQPIAELARLARSNGSLFHCDASQSVGKIPTLVDELEVDLLTVAGHKFYAPKGVGAIYIRDGVELEPLLHGAGHEDGKRAGTLNSAGIIALGEAAKLALEKGLPMSREVRDLLWSDLRSQLGDKVCLNADLDACLPNTLNMCFLGVSGRELLERAQVMASTGAACHSGEASPVLKAMGLGGDRARGTVRLSCGRFTTRDEAAEAAARLVTAYQQLRSQAPSGV